MQESCRQSRRFQGFRFISCYILCEGLIFIDILDQLIDIFEWLVFLNLVLLGDQCLLEVNVNVAKEERSIPVNFGSLDELPGQIHGFDH